VSREVSSRLLGIVLCGGGSARMGRDKAMLDHPQGGTFRSHAVGRLAPLCAQVFLAGRCAEPTDVPTLTDSVADAGPVGGVATALRQATDQSLDAVLVTPVDMPFLTTDDLRILCDTWSEHPDDIHVAVSGDQQRMEPLVAIYPVGCLSAIDHLARGEDRSLSRWIPTQAHHRVSLRSESCRNMNTPEDLRRGPEVSI